MLTCEDKLDDKRRRVSTSISSEKPSGLRQSELRRWHCCWPLCASLCRSELSGSLRVSGPLWEIALTGNLTGNSMTSSSSVESTQKMVGLYICSQEAPEELQEAKKGSQVACSFPAYIDSLGLSLYICVYVHMYVSLYKKTRRLTYNIDCTPGQACSIHAPPFWACLGLSWPQPTSQPAPQLASQPSA